MPRLHLIVAGLSVLGSLAANLPLHPHPSGSTDRVTPGTVRVEALSHITINLLDDRGVIKQVVREYDIPAGEGSGFNVAPEGVVVTATGVVQPDRDVSVYAANRVFAEYFNVKIPADFSRHKLKNPELNGRLQACYPPQRQNSNCIVTTSTKVTVFPYADPPTPEGYPAELLHTGPSPGSPAVLKLTKGGEDSTMPTVPLGTSLGSGIESVDVVGMPARPSAKAPPKVETAHLDPPGGRTFKTAERAKLKDFLAADGDGGAVIDDGKSEVVGFVAGGGGAPVTLTPVDDIRAALVAANVTPRRGPVDVVYETALASYHNKFYANAIPVLEQVLRLRPDHAVAQDHLRFARANRVGASPTAQAGFAAAKKPTGPSPLLIAGGGAAALVIVAAIAVPLLLRRRRQDDDGPPEALAAVPARTAQGTQAMEAAGEGSFPGTPAAAAGQALFCTQCGMRLGKAHRFCGFCGHPVDR